MAFASFDSQAVAAEALHRINGLTVQGKTLVAEYARPPPPSSGQDAAAATSMEHAPVASRARQSSDGQHTVGGSVPPTALNPSPFSNMPPPPSFYPAVQPHRPTLPPPPPPVAPIAPELGQVLLEIIALL